MQMNYFLRGAPLIMLGLLLGGQIANAAEPPRREQRAFAKNSAYLEVGGPGILYSVNFERMLLRQLSVRAGLSMFGLQETTTGETLGVWAMPLTVQYLPGKGSHHLELGLGLSAGMLWSDLNSYERTETTMLLVGTATIGYRYQPPEGGFMFRAAFTPIIGGERFQPLGMPVQPWGGISFGYAF